MNKYMLKSAIATVAITASSASATIISLSPSDINGLDTNTANFDDGALTLTPLVGGIPSTFNADAVRLGIDDGSVNPGAFNDPDTDPFNANGEQLEFVFVTTSGLTQISFDFSRANGPGPGDGVFISGFSEDPGAVITGADNFVSFSNGVLELDLTSFSDTDETLTLSNAAASAGQTLLLTVSDSTQANSQFAITGIQYDNDVLAVPEPSSMALLGLGGLALLLRRKK